MQPWSGTQDPAQSMQARNLVIQVNTLADWNKLYQAFGTRQFNSGGWSSACGLFGYNCTSMDLIDALKTFCTPDDISTIDSYLAAEGITNVVI
jgi:hypothetical protein